MDRYRDRQQAGEVLASALSAYADREDVLVLALPRGGVPVAFEVAQALNLSLDVFIVRKLGVPGHSELAMGALAMGNVKVFNSDILNYLHITQAEIDAVIAAEQQELERRAIAYRDNRPLPDFKNKTVILVDDGIATGATMRAAIKALRELGAAHIVVAVPVADRDMCEKLAPSVDQFICPLRPVNFYAVGAWYDNFSQTEDEEVYRLLKLSQRHTSAHKE